MKKIFGILFVALVCFSSTSFAKTNEEKSMDFVKTLVEEGINDIINSNASNEVRTERFRTLFKEGLDLDFIGKFVLGRYWKTATADEKKDFLQAYTEINVLTWSVRFDEFKGKSFTFQNVTESNSKDQYFVNSLVDMGPSSQPAKVVWRVKKTGDKMKVVDIIAENVSLAITARNEYTAYIKANDIRSLIDDLNQRINTTK